MTSNKSLDPAESARETLRKALHQLGWSPKRLSERSGVHHSIIYRFLGNPTKGVEPDRVISFYNSHRIHRALAAEGVDNDTLLLLKEALGLLDLVGPEGMPSVSSPRPDFVESSKAVDRPQGSPPSDTELTVVKLLQETHELGSSGLWMPAEEKAYLAAGLARPGSERWAEIMLRHCTQMCQQAGDLVKAEDHIRRVEREYLEQTSQPHPLIRALVSDRRGWIRIEQLGYYDEARSLFTTSLAEATVADDTVLINGGHHFRVRALSENAMARTNAWLGARANAILPGQLVRDLEDALRFDDPEARRLAPGNPFNAVRKFTVLALIRPRDALVELNPDYFDETQLHIRALNLARWYVSNEEWAGAIENAKFAFEGYRKAHYPQGTAHASAVWAYALYKELRSGIRPASQLCLDLWVLALLLHPFDSHPLWQRIVAELARTATRIFQQNPAWIRTYMTDLDHRVREREGVFIALDDMYVSTFFPPTAYIRLLLPSTIRATIGAS